MFRAALVTWIALAATAAGASPRADPTVGRAVFTGAATSHPTSLALNPAAIGLATANEVYLAFTSVLDQLTVDRRAIDDNGALVPGERASDARIGFGGMLGAVWQSHRGSLGIALHIPTPELFPSARAMRYHSAGGQQTNYIGVLATSLRIGPVYFGASVSHDITRLQLRYARDSALVAGRTDCSGAPCGFENPAAQEDYAVDVRTDLLAVKNVEVNLGIVARLGATSWLGVSYHNPAGFGVQSELGGNVELTRAPRDGGESITGDATIYVSYPASVDAELRARIWPQLDLTVGGRWQDLSRMRGYDVRMNGRAIVGTTVPEWTERPRGYRDSVALWGGLEQVDRGKRWRFGGRLGFETAAIADDRTAPGAVQPLSLTVDGGAELRIAPNLVLQASYGLQLFAPVRATTSQYDPRAALMCAADEFDYTTPACAALRDGFAIPTAAGDYQRLQHALRIGLRYERQ